eukprot:TRINITY_DN62458_c0_g1_i1.p1 TRINITY_DN62458_c0_g1~~TRINITY_DN62458_c0_g1_i1.p1  ORF type:complete len:413 (-),score=47.47 TRINITY_DN62458_c0_g1_i1:104-1342(-)
MAVHGGAPRLDLMTAAVTRGSAVFTVAALFHVSWLLLPVHADIDNLFPVLDVNNPVARHVACAVPAGVPTVCALYGYEENSRTLEVLITALPTTGFLFETSENYRTYGTDPKYAPTPIQEHELPFRLSDPLIRVVYVPPSDVFPPEGRWGKATYVAKDPESGVLSEPGQIGLSSPANYLAASSFIGGIDQWSISGNIHSAIPSWQSFGWGLLNRYIYGTDEVQYINFDTGSDRSKWYFQAPAGKYCLPELASAYGGTLRFTIASVYGDFSHLNDPLDFITIDCASCNSGRGMRIVRYADNGLQWDGSERVIEVPLTVGAFWRRDHKNTALPLTWATDCEIAAVLAGVTSFKILGDFTKAGEGVAIDDVAILNSKTQPAFPLHCQQGCTCAHYPVNRRVSCCGSSQDIYYPVL